MRDCVSFATITLGLLFGFCQSGISEEVYHLGTHARFGNPFYETLVIWVYSSQDRPIKSDSDDKAVSAQIGSFRVVAPKDYGIMSIVETLNLRMEGDDCVDFIQFQQKITSNMSSPICGTVDPNLNDAYSDTHTGSRTFIDPTGETRVHTYVKADEDSEKLPLVLAKIVFTAYSECPKDLSSSTVARCSMNNNFSCTSRALFCDSRRHCAFDDEFGLDELNCNIETTLKYSFIGVILVLFLAYFIYFLYKRLRRRNKREIKAASASVSPSDDTLDHWRTSDSELSMSW